MQEQGLEVQFPREVIKQAFTTQLIDDGTSWIEMLDKRNELKLTYNQKQAERAVSKIRNQYLPLIEQVYQAMKVRCLA